MKTKVPVLTELNITHVRIEAAVRYYEEDIPNDFPGRTGDMWRGTVEIDTGLLLNWPKGQTGDMHMKVYDSGSYYLLGEDGSTLASIEANYVPHGVVPGEYGDYLILKINEDGIITNWPKRPDVTPFFEEQP